MPILWTVEIDAYIPGGRPLSEQRVCPGMEYAQAVDIVESLVSGGDRAWVCPAVGSQARGEAEDGLRMYAEGRRRLHESVQAAVAAGLRKSEIVRMSGLSRRGLGQIIARLPL